MKTELIIAVLCGLGGMLGWGIADFTAKKTIDKIGDVTTLFWGQLAGIIPLLLLFLFNPTTPRLGGSSWIYLIALGVWSGLSYIPTYKAFGKGKVSLISPIFASNAVVVAILSGVFFGEIIPLGRQFSFLIVFIGVLFITGNPMDIWRLVTNRKNVTNNTVATNGEVVDNKVKGLPEILLAVCLYSVWLIGLDHFISGMNWVPVLLVIRIFSSLSLFIYAKFAKIKLTFTDNKLWKYLLLIGMFDVAAFASLSYGFSATPYTSIVAMLGGAFSLPTIILGRVFLKERATKLQTIGSIVIIVGVMLLALL